MNYCEEAWNLGFEPLFTYTQRLFTRRWKEGDEPYSDHPFDRLFEADYMGNSDFEWGALSKAYGLMRGGQLSAQAIEIVHEGTSRTVYVVSITENAHAAEVLFPLWVEAGCPGVEAARFNKVFHAEYEERPEDGLEGTGHHKEVDTWFFPSRTGLYYNDRLIAWLDINHGIAWTLNPVVANMLMQAFGLNPYN